MHQEYFFSTHSEAIRHQLQDRNLTQAWLAERCGVTEQAVSKWLRGGGLRTATLEKVAAAFELSVPQLLAGNLHQQGVAEEKATYAPIRYIAQTKNSGEISREDNKEGKTVCVFSEDPAAYLIKVANDELRPRYKAGELLLIEPSKAPNPGDDCLVILTEGRQMIMELHYSRAGRRTFGSVIGTGQPRTFDTAQLAGVYRIAGTTRPG